MPVGFAPLQGKALSPPSSARGSPAGSETWQAAFCLPLPASQPSFPAGPIARAPTQAAGVALREGEAHTGATVTRCCVLGPQACDAWKKEAEEAGERASAAGAECELAREQRDALEVQVKKLQEELGRLHVGTEPQSLPPFSDLEALSLSTLYSLQKQLRAHLEQVDKVSPEGHGSPGGLVGWPQQALRGVPAQVALGVVTLLRATTQP